MRRGDALAAGVVLSRKCTNSRGPNSVRPRPSAAGPYAAGPCAAGPFAAGPHAAGCGFAARRQAFFPPSKRLCYNLMFIAAIATCPVRSAQGLPGEVASNDSSRGSAHCYRRSNKGYSPSLWRPCARHSIWRLPRPRLTRLPTWRWATSLWRAVLSWPSSCASRPAKSPNNSFRSSPRWKEWSASPWPGPAI